MGSLFIQEPPLMVLPGLAKAVGLNEAIILQQFHWLLGNPNSGKVIDGKRWIFDTYEEMQVKFFCFWSFNTIRRVIQSLEDSGWLLSCQPEGKFSRRKYYRISQQAYMYLTKERSAELSQVVDSHDAAKSTDDLPKMGLRTAQSGLFRNSPDWAVPLTETPTENNTPIVPFPEQTTEASPAAPSLTPLEKPQKKTPGKGPLQLRAEKLLNRRESTPLTVAEQRAFTKNKPCIESTTEADWQALEAFYRAPQALTFARKDLGSLVNNWNGEIDKAHAWRNENSPHRSAFKPILSPEPTGWKGYVATNMPECPYAPGMAKQSASWEQVEPAHQKHIASMMNAEIKITP